MNRRTLLASLTGGAALLASNARIALGQDAVAGGPGPSNLITDVPGLRVGQAEDAKVRTGVTVILAEFAPAEVRLVNCGHHPPLLHHSGGLRPLTGTTANGIDLEAYLLGISILNVRIHRRQADAQTGAGEDYSGDLRLCRRRRRTKSLSPR